MPSPTISLLTPEDIPSLGEVYYLSFLSTALFAYNWPGVERNAFGPWMTGRAEAAFKGRSEGNKSDFLVAKLEGKVVGYASYTYFPDAAERRAGTAKKRLLPVGGTEQRAGNFLAKLDLAKASEQTAHYCSSSSSHSPLSSVFRSLPPSSRPLPPFNRSLFPLDDTDDFASSSSRQSRRPSRSARQGRRESPHNRVDPAGGG
jgi:hypothetical protein